jgi:hypothetical protein
VQAAGDNPFSENTDPVLRAPLSTDQLMNTATCGGAPVDCEAWAGDDQRRREGLQKLAAVGWATHHKGAPPTSGTTTLAM